MSRLAAVVVTAAALLMLPAPARAGGLAGNTPLAQAPLADAAAASPLSRAGLRASGATLTGRTLTVKVRARGALRAELAVVRGTRVLGTVRARIAKGTRTLRLTLPRAVTGSGLRLRISVRVGPRPARGTIALRLVAGALGPAPVPPATPTAPTTPTTPTTPVTPPPPPTPRVTLSAAAIAEDQTAGSAVGTLAAADAPDVGAAPAFTLVSGSGDADNAAFAVDGATLRTAGPLNFETKASYQVRVRATSGGSVETALTVSVIDVNEITTAQDQSFTGTSRALGNTALVISAGRDAATNPAGVQKTVSGDLLAGATDEDGDALSIVPAVGQATTAGGKVTLEADGDAVYLPPTGCTAGNDTFTFTVTDGRGGVDTATATVARLGGKGCAWYVDGAAAPSGDGSSTRPFQDFTGLQGAATGPDGINQWIYAEPGVYAGGLTFASGQRLTSRRAGLTVDGTVLRAPDALVDPTVINGGVVLGFATEAQGINFGSTADGFALSGANVGSTTVNTITPGTVNNPLGGAVDIDGGTIGMSFSSLSSGGGTHGVRLNAVDGTFTVGSGGAISGASTAGVALTGAGTVNASIASSVAAAAGGSAVTVSGQTGGVKNLTGAVSSTGTGLGVSLSANTGASIAFTGGLSINRSAGTAFSATGGGTVSVTAPGAVLNQLTSTNGIALNVADTTIGAPGMTFRSITTSGTTAISLSNTGSSGGLTVTGGANDGSGGVLSGMGDNPAVLLSGVGGGVSLAKMLVQTGGDDGIRATNVTGLSVSGSSFTDLGNAAGERALDLSNVTGTIALTNLTLSGNLERNLSLVNTSGTANATITGGTFGANSTALGGDNVFVSADQSAVVNLDASGTTFTGSRDDHIDFRTLPGHTGSARLRVTANATFASPAQNPSGYTSTGGGIRVSPIGNGSTEVRVSGSTITGARGPAIKVSTDGVPSAAGPALNVEAEIANNTIGSAGTSNSGSVNDRAVVLEAWNRALLQASVTNNVLRQYNFGGIYGLVRGAAGTAAALDLSLSGNNLANPASAGTYGVRLEAGNTANDTGTMCLNAGANAISDGGLAVQDLWLTKTGTAALRLPGLGTLTAAGAQALLQAQIGGGADVLVSDSGSGSYASGSCQQPSIP